MNNENKITKANNVLVVLPYEGTESNELQYLTENFCGTVVNQFSDIPKLANQSKVLSVVI